MSGNLQQIERNHYRAKARSAKAHAIAERIIRSLDVHGYSLEAEIDRLRGTSQGERDVLAFQAGQRRPSAETWDATLAILETAAADRERNPDPFAGAA